MIMIDDYEQVKRKVDSLERERLRAEGEYSSAMRVVSDEMGIKTIEEAEKVVEQDKTDEIKKAAEYTKEFDRFKKDFPQVLE